MLDHHLGLGGQAAPLGNAVWERHLLPPDLADGLRRTRQARGLSLRQVARMAGISAGFLSRLERAERCPRVSTAVRLAAVLDLDDDLADELIGASVDDAWADRATLAVSPRSDAGSR
jgi:transcriptional regulator with XRE-family HTH domain